MMSVSAWQRCFLSHGQNGKGCKKRCTIAPFAGSGSWLKPAGDGGLDDESMASSTVICNTPLSLYLMVLYHNRIQENAREKRKLK